MIYSIFVILSITATLLVFSLVLFFKAKKKEKTFAIYFLIPICIGLMTIIGMSYGLSLEISYNDEVKERTHEVTNLVEDYSYYLENWGNVVDYCEKNEVNFNTEYNLEPVLNQERLKYKIIANDTFYTYFARNYPRSSASFNGDFCITLRFKNEEYYDQNSSITINVYKFSGYYSYSSPNFTSRTLLNEESNKLTNLKNNLELGCDIEFENYHIWRVSSGFTVAEYIIMIVYTSLIELFVTISMIHFLIRKESKQTQVLTNNNTAGTIINDDNILKVQTNTIEEPPQLPPKPSWEELKTEEQKVYLDNAIKKLYEKQLEDKNLELTRQQRAIKKDSLDHKEFYLEDLNEEEKQIVEQNAKSDYENEENENKKVKNEKTKNNEKVNSFIKSSPINIIKSCLLILLRGFLGGVRLRAQISGENGFFTVYFDKKGLTFRRMSKVCKIVREQVVSCKLQTSVKLEKYQILLTDGHKIILSADSTTNGKQDSYPLLVKSLGAEVME